MVRDQAAADKLISARVRMLLKTSFWGNLATRLVLVEVDDEDPNCWCTTAGTDGHNFYYSPKFINRLSQNELVFLFGHELLHVAYDHIGRRGDRNPDLSNIAADYVVNGDLIKFGVGTPINKIPLLHDTKFDGWSYEQVYAHLYDNAEKLDVGELVKRLLDDHLTKAGAPKLSEEEQRKIQDEFKEAMLSALESVGADKVPAGIRRLIGDLTEPQLDWRQFIAQQVESLARFDYTFNTPSRRGWSSDIILPSQLREKSIDVTIALDMSGSIGPAQIKDFFGEVCGLMSQFKSYNVTIFTFDTQVYNMQTFTEDDADELLNYEPVGGGGTSFECIFEHLKEENLQPKLLCIFTDMLPGGSWGDADYCPTIFLAHKTNIEAPYGITIKYQ